MNCYDLATVFTAILWTLFAIVEAGVILQRFKLLTGKRAKDPSYVISEATRIKACVTECVGRYSPCRGVNYKADDCVCEMFGPESKTILMVNATEWGFYINEPKRGENLKQGAVATQSSSALFGDERSNPYFAIDGIKIAEHFVLFCTHTLSNRTNPWWMVDFNALHKFVGIVIWNRVDCCYDRLKNLIITISPTLDAIDDVTTNQCATFAGPATKTENPIMVYCEREMQGRFLKILAVSDEVLALCEVEFLIREA